MKIKIVRSFGQTKQLRQFEPINSFCSVEAECEESEQLEISKKLDEFVRSEVAKTLLSYAPQGASEPEKQEKVAEDFL